MEVAGHCVDAGLVSVPLEKLARFSGGAISEVEDMLGWDLRLTGDEALALVVMEAVELCRGWPF